jgi:DNA-binding NarL/FixJ family response regulator
VSAGAGYVDRNLRPATMIDVLEIVTRSRRAFHVSRLPETIVLAANAAAVELYCQSADAMIGRHASSLFHGADEVHTAVALSGLAAGAVDSYCAQRRLATPSGVHVWLCVRRFDVDESQIAVAMTIPIDQPHPLDGVEEEFATARGISWVSTATSGTTGVDASASRSNGESTFAVLDRLPARQREIVAALLLGQRTSAIAASMFLSDSTVRSHLSAIFKAFGVHSQTELLAALRPQKSAAEATRRAPPTNRG